MGMSITLYIKYIKKGKQKRNFTVIKMKKYKNSAGIKFHINIYRRLLYEKISKQQLLSVIFR